MHAQAPVQPVRRDLDFDIPQQITPEEVTNWHGQGRHVSHFFNALSVFFPEGERFFIHSVRHYRDRITDPALQRDVQGFIGQEAMHGREHVEYNELMDKAGLPATKLDRFIGRLLERVKKVIPNSMQLAVTLALEHFTAMLAHLVLTQPKALAGSNPRLTALWRWHALEETEHKAVAYDVYEKALGKGVGAYLLRCGALLIVSAIFLALMFVFHIMMIRADKQARGIGGWLSLVKFLYFSPGALSRLLLPWLDYFRPNFHPWDHDNRELLAEVGPLSATYAATR